MSEPPRAQFPKNLLMVRLGAMGDVIHTMPAAAALRRAFPHTQIGWIIEERWAELLCAKGASRSGPRTPERPLVDFVHVVNTKSWRKSPLSSETRRQLSAALKEVRDERYEIAVDFQGAIKSALLARLSESHTVVGMKEPRETPARVFYSTQIETAGAHVIEQYQSLAAHVMRQFGHVVTEGSDGAIEIPCDQAAEAAVCKKLQGVSQKIVLINPGAGWGAKQWPAERYGEVAAALAKEGFRIFVNYGPGEEFLAHSVELASGGVSRPVACSLAELIAFTRRASLFIGGDTGPLHLAIALGVPVVAIFGPTDPARNGPYGGRSVVLRNPASRTSLSHTSTPDPGLLRIKSVDVVAAARQLLGEAHG